MFVEIIGYIILLPDTVGTKSIQHASAFSKKRTKRKKQM